VWLQIQLVVRRRSSSYRSHINNNCNNHNHNNNNNTFTERLNLKTKCLAFLPAVFYHPHHLPHRPFPSDNLSINKKYASVCTHGYTYVCTHL
jgi:hypothetical protein